VSLATLYQDALRGEDHRQEIADLREKFRRAVKEAERSMDEADREIARMEG
jgi:hypothetical protein